MTDHRLIERWSKEYRQGGIPSSVREAPSGAVVWAVEELKRQGFPLRSCLDVGCGKGRNSLYLASLSSHVTSLDFTPDAIEHLQSAAAAQNLAPLIRALVHDVTEDWPVAPASMDLVVDAFCFKHIAPHAARMAYRASLLRSLRNRGHFMISFASIGDGYYGQYVTEDTGNGEQLAIDPVVGVESVLYSRDAVAAFFAPELTIFAELQNDKPSVMHGKEFARKTTALLMQHNPRRF